MIHFLSNKIVYKLLFLAGLILGSFNFIQTAKASIIFSQPINEIQSSYIQKFEQYLGYKTSDLNTDAIGNVRFQLTVGSEDLYMWANIVNASTSAVLATSESKFYASTTQPATHVTLNFYPAFVGNTTTPYLLKVYSSYGHAWTPYGAKWFKVQGTNSIDNDTVCYDVEFVKNCMLNSVSYIINSGGYINVLNPSILSDTEQVGSYAINANFNTWNIALVNIPATTSSMNLILDTAYGSIETTVPPNSTDLNKIYNLQINNTIDLPNTSNSSTPQVIFLRAQLSIPNGQVLYETDGYFAVTNNANLVNTIGNIGTNYTPIDTNDYNLNDEGYLSTSSVNSLMRNKLGHKIPFVYVYQVYDAFSYITNSTASGTIQTLSLTIPSTTAAFNGNTTTIFSQTSIPFFSQQGFYNILPQATWTQIKSLWGAGMILAFGFYIIWRIKSLWQGSSNV